MRRHGTKNRKTIGLGATACKHYIGWLCAKRRGHFGPSLFKNLPSRSSG